MISRKLLALVAATISLTGCGWGDKIETVEMRRSTDGSTASCRDLYAVSIGLGALLTENYTSTDIARCVFACRRLGFEVVTSPPPKIRRPPTEAEAADISDAECGIGGKPTFRPPKLGALERTFNAA
jgi:hypothetical protein